MSVAEQIKKQIADNCLDKIFVDRCVVVKIIIPWTQIPEHISTPAIGRWQLDKTEKQDDEHCGWWLTYYNVEAPKKPLYGIGVKAVDGKHEVRIARSENKDEVLAVVDSLNDASRSANWSVREVPFYLKETHE